MSLRNGVGDPRVQPRVTIRVGSAVVPVDDVSLDYAISWVTDNQRDCWQVMVTPNLHHLRVVCGSPRISERYSGAAMSLADGWPVAWLASRVSGRPFERVVGADLFQKLVERPGESTRLVLVGGTAGRELDGLLHRCRQRGWQVCSEPAPRIELVDPELRAELVKRVALVGSGGIVVIGVGAPLQEQLATEIAASPGRGAILCLGMSINFSSGLARRAPTGLSALRLEWAYRALSEPRRLLMRYVKDSLVLISLMRENPRRRRA
jgi:exopolysaccharide biosynthesis WecB/TagA/CpsF family protein